MKTLSDIADDLERALSQHEFAWNSNGKCYGENVERVNDRLSQIHLEYAAYFNNGIFARGGNDEILKKAGRLTTVERIRARQTAH